MRVFVWLCCCCILGFCGVALSAESPQETVAATQRAIDQRDMKAFEARVDIDALLNQGLKAFQTYLAREGTGALPPVLALMALSANTPQTQGLLNDLLKKELLGFIRYGIESGHFAGKPIPGVKPTGLVAPLLNDASLGRKILKVSGKPVQEAKRVRLPCSLKDEGNGRTYPLELRLQQDNGVWRIVELANLDTLLKRVGSEINGR